MNVLDIWSESFYWGVSPVFETTEMYLDCMLRGETALKVE